MFGQRYFLCLLLVVFITQLQQSNFNNIFIAMSRKDQQMISIIENLPLRLDRFWKARILRLHEDESHFLQNLKLCLAEANALELMQYLKEMNLLEHYIAAR